MAPLLAYSVREFSKATSISERTAREIIARGTIKVRRVGTRVLIPASEAERFVNDSESWTPANTGRHVTTSEAKGGGEA
jgi:excisionase family DNA binding protein